MAAEPTEKDLQAGKVENMNMEKKNQRVVIRGSVSLEEKIWEKWRGKERKLVYSIFTDKD